MKDLLARALEGLEFASEYIEHEDINKTIKDIQELLARPVSKEPVAYLKTWKTSDGVKYTVSFYADNCSPRSGMLDMRTIPLVENRPKLISWICGLFE